MLVFRHDVIIFQKTYSRHHVRLMKLCRFFGKLTFLDIDDSPSRSGNRSTLDNFTEMVTCASGVLAGSPSLVQLCGSHQSNTHLIPSCIKLENYPVHRMRSVERVCLGWIGNGSQYKRDLISELVKPLTLLSGRYRLRLKIVGSCGELDLERAFGQIVGLQVDLVDEIEWGLPHAVADALADVDIGLYPLIEDIGFNHYKCGFKALEYMASGIPVVSSDVSANSTLISQGEDGFLVRTEEQWVEYLDMLIRSPGLRERMGKSGRLKVESTYSIDFAAAKLDEAIRGF